MAATKTHYQVLGLDPEASPAAIKTAYRALARAHHPDGNHSKTRAQLQESEARMAEILIAYEVLSDPEKRAAYDASLTGDHEDLALMAETTTLVLSRTTHGAKVEGFLRRHGVKDAPGLVGDGVRLLARALERRKPE